LEESDSFKIPAKVYGSPEKLAKRYLNTFNNTDGNLGVLLTGVKGTGKSLLAKMVCVESNLPVIMISEPFMSNELKSFLNNIKQEVIILIDEFEKIYRDVKHQETFLSLLDGVFEGQKLYILTSNATTSVSTYLLNRPSRIHYLKQYDGLDKVLVEEIVGDLLESKIHKKELIRLLDIAGLITVDMLMAIIREMNMYGESPKAAIELLNIKPESATYKVEVFEIERKIGGKEDEEMLGSSFVHHHPLGHSMLKFQYYNSSTSGVSQIHFNLEESEIDVDGEVITIKNKRLKNKVMKVVCTPKTDYAFNFQDM
jgi:SpoVK/Ycf46/Vps4 family AAA+-type ATPase